MSQRLANLAKEEIGTEQIGQPSVAAGDLAVVVPTFNERENVAVLSRRVAGALDGLAWRLLFVDDDSPDGTAEAIRDLAEGNFRIACLRRIGRRGLAGAVIEGVLATDAPFVAVMDADLQHDESLLPSMHAILARGETDLVVASRYLDGGSGEGLSPARRAASRMASRLASWVLKAPVSDPVSGFFMVRREMVERVAGKLSNEGFKVLFDLIACQPAPLRIAELPYVFRQRRAGRSKFDARIVLDYLGLVLRRLTGGVLPPRALFFGLVGTSGLAVHLIALRLGLWAGAPFIAAQAAAAVSAMTSNFLLNNAVTYRDRRLRGLALIHGYLRFVGLCAVGLVVNLAVADWIHRLTPPWWLAGAAGALLGAAWNYVSTRLVVW